MRRHSATAAIVIFIAGFVALLDLPAQRTRSGAVASADITKALGFTPLNPANNLSEITAATARTNLGLGSSATHATGEYLTTANNLSDVTAATARTNLGVGAAPLTGTSSAVSGGLTIGVCNSTTVTVANSTTAMAVHVTPATYPGDGVVWSGYVSTNGTVTIKECGLAVVTPTSTSFNVRVIP